MSDPVFQTFDTIEPEFFEKLDDLFSGMQGSGMPDLGWRNYYCEQTSGNFENIYGVIDDSANTFIEKTCITTLLEKQQDIVETPGGKLFNEFIEVESEASAAEMKTSSVGSLQTTRGKEKIAISKTELEKHFGKPLDAAVKALGVSRSTIKRNCRLHGYKRWPKSRRDISVLVKAKYENNKFIQFQLFEYSGIDELHQQVTKRLKKSYTIHYPNNEDELILIACDDDLQNHISSSKILGNEYFNIILEQI